MGYLVVFVFLCFFSSTWAVNSKYVIPQSDGTLRYTPYNDKGDTMIDFSRVGYRHYDVPIPNVPVIARVKPVGNKASDVTNIQNAINALASHPIDTNTGFRGALLLEPGEYNIDSTIYLNISGVVLRGSGMASTVLYGSAKRVYNLIEAGRSVAQVKPVGNKFELTGYIKVGTMELNVADAKSKFKVGQTVIVAARKNENWIKTNGMDKIVDLAPADVKDKVKNWDPFESLHERVVTALNDNSIKLNNPIIEAIDPKWGGGYVTVTEESFMVPHVGVEDLCSYSYYDPNIKKTYNGVTRSASANSSEKMMHKKEYEGMVYLADDNHAARLLTFNGVVDGFARRICGKHFNHLVWLYKHSKRITISDAVYSDPVSTIAGANRYPYCIDGASEILFENCHASWARHAFVFGARNTGPNVFFNCTSENDLTLSEPHHRWSFGALYDNIHGKIGIQNRLYEGDGMGWGGASFVAWNTEGYLALHSPVTDWNFAVGHVGVKHAAIFGTAPGGVDRSWESYGTHVQPKSLFLAQLGQRRRGK